MADLRNVRHAVAAIVVAGSIAGLMQGCGEPGTATAPHQPEEAPAAVQPPAPPVAKPAAPPDTPTPPAPGAAPAPPPEAVPVQMVLDAAFEGDVGLIQRALQSGSDPDAANPEGRTGLMLAAFNSHSGVVRELLTAGARVDLRDEVGRTALMYAATAPDIATVELILGKKPDVNAVDGHEQWTALMFAAAEGHNDVVKLLLKHGANATLRDTDGDTAANFARQRGHRALAALLDATAADAVP